MKNIARFQYSRAFSLLELSIVITIIALLMGGLFAGQSLLRGAQLRNVMTDAGKYLAAVNGFRDQYRYLPGDAPTAQKYWSATANGDGDGMVSGDERYRFWQQLKFAGLIERSFTGVAGSAPNLFVLGDNVPESRVAKAGWSFYYLDSGNGTSVYNLNYGNMLTFGTALANSPPINAALAPADAYSIDNKMDDGKPGTGKWVATSTGGANLGAANSCTSSATAASASYTGTDIVGCSFFIMSGY